MNESDKPLVVLQDDPMAMIKIAIEKGLETTHIEKLMELQERWERDCAAKGFAHAKCEFARRCQAIHKCRQTKPSANFEGFTFASYDDIMRQAGPIMADVGLSASFDTESLDGGIIRMTCRLRWGTHVDETRFSAPIPGGLKVSATQQYGACLSYLKRYTLCAALNIVVTDEDTEQIEGTISKFQEAELKALINTKQVDVVRFLKWANIDGLDQMPSSAFAKALDMLKRKETPK